VNRRNQASIVPVFAPGQPRHIELAQRNQLAEQPFGPGQIIVIQTSAPLWRQRGQVHLRGIQIDRSGQYGSTCSKRDSVSVIHREPRLHSPAWDPRRYCRIGAPRASMYVRSTLTTVMATVAFRVFDRLLMAEGV
jgi:hypothetical protein